MFQRYCESIPDERAATAKPAADSMRTALVTVFCIAVASSRWFFPRFSEANLVRAVGKPIPVRREKVEARKERIDRTPRSVGVRAFVFVTTM